MNVAFLIYKRPDLTARVFRAIARARPDRLLIVADGPKTDADRSLCEEARRVALAVDWPCDVRTEFALANMGCKRRVATGLDWVFSQVEEAIILEDDCLPHPDFFRFCQEMLERFRGDMRVGHICGTNFDFGRRRAAESYGFSMYTSIWGWATWRRAWTDYDVSLAGWPERRARRWHRSMFPTRAEACFFERLWDGVYAGNIDTWDGQWLFARLVSGSLAVRPAVNLISNIGFGAGIEATHTGFDHPIANLPTEPMAFPLCHPSTIRVDRESDARLGKLCFRSVGRLERLKSSRVFNRHWYGALLRRVPLVGAAWAASRAGSRRSA